MMTRQQSRKTLFEYTHPHPPNIYLQYIYPHFNAFSFTLSLHKLHFFLSKARPGHEVIKLFFMLNSTEHKFFMLINVKMPTIVGILTFMSGKNSILGLSDPKKYKFLDIFILMSI